MTTIQHLLEGKSHTWLVTGAAGFIGSHLCEQLLFHGQTVVGLDDFSAGKPGNLDDLQSGLGEAQRSAFSFIEGDIVDPATCARACRKVDYVLHQAAMGSVPQSIEDPAGAHASNVTGFLNILDASRQLGVRRVVYASSCAIYGNEAALPIVESSRPAPLSPYAATKWMDEIIAQTFHRAYGMESVGLRYFNVYGPRQDPQGAYAAVIPAWISAVARRQPVFINGDGETTRDFCFVTDVVQANLRAALVGGAPAQGAVYNVASGQSVSLNTLLHQIIDSHEKQSGAAYPCAPEYRAFRAGDVRHSSADIALIREKLGFTPRVELAEGIRRTVEWFAGSA